MRGITMDTIIVKANMRTIGFFKYDKMLNGSRCCDHTPPWVRWLRQATSGVGECTGPWAKGGRGGADLSGAGRDGAGRGRAGRGGAGRIVSNYFEVVGSTQGLQHKRVR